MALQGHPIEDQALGAPLNLSVSSKADDEVVAAMWVRGKVKVPCDIALVIHGGFGERALHVVREITAQVSRVEYQIRGTATDPSISIDAHDKLTAIVWVPCDVSFSRYTRVGQFWGLWFGFLG